MPAEPAAIELKTVKLNAEFLAVMKEFDLVKAEEIFTQCEAEKGLKWQEVFKAGGDAVTVGKQNIVNAQENPFKGLKKKSEKEFRAEVDAFLSKILGKLGDDIKAINDSGIIILAAYYGAEKTLNALMKKEGLDLEFKVNRNETALTAALSLAYLAQDAESKEFGKKAIDNLLAKGAKSYASLKDGHSCLNLIGTNSIVDGMEYAQRHSCEAGEYKQFLDSITAVPLKKEEIEDEKTFASFKLFLNQAFIKSREVYLKAIYDETAKNPGTHVSNLNFGMLLSFDQDASDALIDQTFVNVENEQKRKELQEIYKGHLEQIKSDYLSMEKFRQQARADFRYGEKIQEVIADYLLLEELRKQVRADFRCGKKIQEIIKNSEADPVTKKLLETLQPDIEFGQNTRSARTYKILPERIVDVVLGKPDFHKINAFVQNLKPVASKKGTSGEVLEGRSRTSWQGKEQERETEKDSAMRR